MQNLKHDLWARFGQLRRHWLPLAATGLLIGAWLAGSPAWAAPVTRPLNQTVPRPTPTTPFELVPTATPWPTDTPSPGGGSNDEAERDDQTNPEIGLGDEADPSDLFPAPPEEEKVEPVELTATVAVGTLNVRAGPGMNFNILGSLTANTQVTVTARNEDAAWWYVCCLPGTTVQGWVSALLLNPHFDRAQAQTLIPLFGATSAVVTPTATPQPQLAPASQPLAVGFRIDPPFVWQGITATLTISVSNPNTVDVVMAELSDELPAALTLVEARATADGKVETILTPRGRSLLLFRWERIPAGTGVSAIIVVKVAEDLAPGAVIDNLVGVRARNAAYNAGALTIGMPPLFPPIFD